MKRIPRGWWIVGITILLAGFVFVLPAGLIKAGDFLVHADPIQRSGAVVLLSGGGSERLLEAAHLMQARQAELLLLTDTARLMPDGMPEWQYLKLEAISSGVSPAKIEVTPHIVGSTLEEAQALRDYLQIHSISSCIVVTDPYHTRRTRLIFRREFENTGLKVLVVPASDHWYQAGTWFTSWRGWQATVSEYSKILVFLAGGI